MPWQALRRSLQEWSAAPSSAMAGAVRFSQAVIVSAREWTWADQAIPFVVIVDALLERG